MELFVLPDEDAICQAIFAGTVRLGRPDAFLARELTDGVMHFLLSDVDDAGQPINELVAKLVRELGHPQLAHVLDEKHFNKKPWTGYSTNDLRSPTKLARESVFPPDLMAAHDAGLLQLDDLHLADRLIECNLPGPGEAISPHEWNGRLIAARKVTGRTVTLDNAACCLGAADAGEWLIELVAGLRSTSLQALITLNAETGACESAKSLFSSAQPSLWGEEAINPARELLQAGIDRDFGDAPIHWRWHLSNSDFSLDKANQLAWLAEAATKVKNLTLAFDRTSKASVSTDGTLMSVEASLSGLRRYLPDKVSAEEFIAKIGSLVRLALAAGHAKRKFLRQNGSSELRSGFLIDRSALQLLVTGMNHVAERFGIAANRLFAFRQSVLQQVENAVAADGHHQVTHVLFDDPPCVSIEPTTSTESLPELVESISQRHIRVKITTGVGVNETLSHLLELLWLASDVERVDYG